MFLSEPFPYPSQKRLQFQLGFPFSFCTFWPFWKFIEKDGILQVEGREVMDVNRSSENINMDKVDRSMSTAYFMAVSGLSQLYHLGQSQQMLAFRASERHSLVKMMKLIQWGDGLLSFFLFVCLFAEIKFRFLWKLSVLDHFLVHILIRTLHFLLFISGFDFLFFVLMEKMETKVKRKLGSFPYVLLNAIVRLGFSLSGRLI